MYVGYLSYYLLTTRLFILVLRKDYWLKALIPLARHLSSSFRAIQSESHCSSTTRRLHKLTSMAYKCEADLLYVDLISTGTLVGTLLPLYNVIV